MDDRAKQVTTVEARYAILDLVELEFRLSPPLDNIQRWIYFPTTLKRPARKPHLPGYVKSCAIEELKNLGFLDDKGLLTEEGLAFYRAMRPQELAPRTRFYET